MIKGDGMPRRIQQFFEMNPVDQKKLCGENLPLRVGLGACQSQGSGALGAFFV